MKRIAMLAAAAITLCILVTVFADDPKPESSEIRELKQQVAALQAEVRQIKVQLQTINTRLDRQQPRLTPLNSPK